MSTKPTYDELLKKVEYYEKKEKYNIATTDFKSVSDIDLNKKYLENLISYANTPIIVWNTKFKIQRFNKAFEHLTGYSSEEIIGKKLDILFPKESIQQTKEEINKTLSGDFWETIEIPILCKNGDTRIVLWNSANIYDDNKNLISTIAQGNDITERIATEKELKIQNLELQKLKKNTEENEHKLKEAQLIGKIGNWDYNLIENSLTWSDEIFTILEIDKSLYCPSFETLQKFIHPNDKDFFYDSLKNNLEEKIDYTFEFRLLLNNNIEKWVIQRGTRNYDSTGKPIRSFGTLQEITEQKNIEFELIKLKEKAEENELYFRTIFDAQPNLISVTKASDFTFTYINKSFTKFTGYTYSELLGCKAGDINLFVNAEDIASIKTELNKKGKVSYFEVNITLKNGSIKTMSLSLRFFKYNGELHILTIAQDITQKKKIENENIKLSTAVIQSASSIVITDIHGNIEYTNPKFTETTGYTAQEVLGKNPKILNSGLQSKEYYTNLWKTISSGKVWNGEFQNKNKNGRIFWEQTTITPIKSEKGELINYLAIKENITELKENQKLLEKQNEELNLVSSELSEKNTSLLKSKNRFSNLFEKSPISLWEEDFSEVIALLDRKSKQTSNLKKYLNENQDFVLKCASKVKVLNANNVTLDLLGLSTKEELLIFLSKNFNATSTKTFKDELVSLASNNKEFVRETKLVKGDGSIVSVIIKSVLLDDNTAIVSMVNITDIKNAEIKLKIQNNILKKAKEKAEESDQLKTEFLNNMSHEIRTPLNGILGFSEILCDSNTTEDKRKYFGSIIKNSGNQLMQVIDDILEISRLGTKQVTANNKEACLNTIMLQLFSVFEIRAKENKIPLYLKKGLLDTESTVLTDELKLNKILSNLLENAFKFTNEGHIEFGYILNNSEPAQLEIFVKDTGVGINKINQKTIFDRFSQEEKELSKKFGGLGLGLSIAKENSELLGGTITLESEKGKGATFTVIIPYTPTKLNFKISKEKITPETNEAKPTLLIAEDEEVNYLFLETLLHDSMKFDCTILHAKNGIEAVDICRNNSAINLVLMDIKMPHMNGFEATKLIKEINPNLPIIAQTAYSTSSDIHKSIEVGCNDFISKPISKTILNEILKKHLKIKKA
ncbi:PAS domain S-box protein [Lutibacter sp.]|uniref:hybrid sensor histidine kinase/response regulator n=1 Tax=Lutibacter sp. TaxID=1925666 RepID=UPI0035622998